MHFQTFAQHCIPLSLYNLLLKKTGLGLIWPQLYKLPDQYHLLMTSFKISTTIYLEVLFNASTSYSSSLFFFQTLTFDALIERAIVSSLYHQVQPSVRLNYQSHLHD